MYGYNARFYDSELGRFAQADSIVPVVQGVQAWDRYAYVNNNPVLWVDPSGHMAQDIEGGNGTCKNSLDCVYPEGHDKAGELIIKPQRPTKSQRIEEMIDWVVPEKGTVSVGFSATAGAGVYPTGAINIFSLDSQGNLAILSRSLGGGALLPGAAEATFSWTTTNADSVDQLGGWSMAIGGSFELGGSVGYESIYFKDSSTGQYFSGDSITIGLGGSSPVPAEGHVGVNYTWIPRTINLYDKFGLNQSR